MNSLPPASTERGPVGARLHYRPVRGDSVVRDRLLFAGISLLTVFLLGVLGYYLIGGGRWSVEECAYMVLITITSVGYGEVIPVSSAEGGRVFTMVLLVSGMGVSFYFLSALTAFIIEGDLGEALWRRRMDKRLKDLVNHYIVCGAGRTGTQVAEELSRAGKQVVVIEHSTDQLERVERRTERFFLLRGDATEDEVLREAGVERASGIVAALRHDQDNLFVALSARQLNPGLRIVSRGNEKRIDRKLELAGADAVISPTNIGGRRMAQELLRPNVVGFLDFIGRDQERNLSIEELTIPPGSPVDGVRLDKSRIRDESNALVLAVMSEGRRHYNPERSFELEAGMTLIVLGEGQELERLARFVAS